MSRSGLAANAPRDAPKLLSLLNSTLSSSHELVRSLSIVSQPSASLLKPIKRNLTTVAAGISALQDEQIILEQEGKRSKVSLEEVRRKEDELIEVKGAWDRLCEVLNKHETTAELLTDVKENHPNLFEAIQTKATTIETLSPYRDDPAHKQSNPYTIEDEEDGRSNAELLKSQQQQMASQDNQLDHLSASIGRQHHLSLQMNEELDIHASLLDEMDRDVENTGARLGRASRRLDQFTNSLKEHGSTWTIFVLIIILVMLIAIFK